MCSTCMTTLCIMVKWTIQVKEEDQEVKNGVGRERRGRLQGYIEKRDVEFVCTWNIIDT